MKLAKLNWEPEMIFDAKTIAVWVKTHSLWDDIAR
ncbi:MAG: hypothetical protein ACI9GM_000628 [Salibacteraceae bacterium]|jgi:hypothetical protein